MRKLLLILVAILLTLTGCAQQTSVDAEPSENIIDKTIAVSLEKYGFSLSEEDGFYLGSDDGLSIWGKDTTSKVVDVKNVWIEKNENGVTSFSEVCVKFQNKLQENELEKVDITVFYLDKEGKRIGEAAMFWKDNVSPNEIVVLKKLFLMAALKPEDIKDEWSGELECEVTNVKIPPRN